MKQLIYKFSIIIVLFLCTVIVFNLFQKPSVYDVTLKKITHTFVRDARDKSLMWEVDNPYAMLNNQTPVIWDGYFYKDIRQNYYNQDDQKYAFFPLFPLFWKLFPGGNLYIGLINYLLFAFSIILLSKYLLKDVNISFIGNLCVFIIAMVLPPVVTFYLPYADALFTFTFTIALLGLIKNKYWLYFIFLMLFSMSRPIFINVGLPFVIIDLYYFMKHRNFVHFIKELSLKLAPLIAGTFIVFFMFYLNSGSFAKYFEVHHKYWNFNFGIPSRITDWSVEAFSMNAFTIFFVLIPSLILIIYNFIKLLRSEKHNELPTIFKGDLNFIKDYFLNFSIVYFWGIFLYVLFFQNGSLNGLSRYIFASPFIFIYLFNVIPVLNKIKAKVYIPVTVLLLSASIISLTHLHDLGHSLYFNQSGFFTLFLDFIFLFSLKYMNNFVKLSSVVIIALYNILWITYLYNIYLCDGWIYT